LMFTHLMTTITIHMLVTQPVNEPVHRFSMFHLMSFFVFACAVRTDCLITSLTNMKIFKFMTTFATKYHQRFILMSGTRLMRCLYICAGAHCWQSCLPQPKHV